MHHGRLFTLSTVIEFLIAEDKVLIKLHEHLKNVYGDVTVDVSSIRCWVHHCEEVAEGVILSN